MSGFENFWNFKTMLEHEEPAFDDVDSKPDYGLRMSVPLLSTIRLPTTELYPVGSDDAAKIVGVPVAPEKNFDEDLQNLHQLTIAELQDLRRKIALHSHPDLKFRIGSAHDFDLMSKANGMIDDEIKRRP